MALEYVIYCDESDEKGSFFSNFYGGALVRSTDLIQVAAILEDKKAELNLHGEVKWQKVTANYRDKYIDMMEVFFDLIKDDLVKMRVMFTQNIHVPVGLSEFHQDYKYFLLYYQFIKHAFGLRYSNPDSESIRVRLILDRLPDTKEKVGQFRDHIVSLNRNSQIRAAKIEFAYDQIAEVESHDHVVLQYLDIVLGSIQFRLNDKHKIKPPGSRTRGKRTIAKEQVYKYINRRIRDIYPNFNIGISTAKKGDSSNVWNHPYRHWRFVPNNQRYDLTKTKGKK